MVYTRSVLLKAGLVTVLACASAAVIIENCQSPSKAVLQPVTPPPIVAPIGHTADWYVAHSDDLRTDEKRCAGDAVRLSMATCQNVASADTRLTVLRMQKAAADNAAEDTASKTNSSPQ